MEWILEDLWRAVTLLTSEGRLDGASFTFLAIALR